MPMRLRLFKTRNFANAASKAWICDSQLREAFSEMLGGQADNLGGGVWKKRLNQNRHRSIVLAKGRHYWVYQLLYAKQNQSNISQSELVWFRSLAKIYEGFSEAQIQQMLDLRDEAFESIHQSAEALYAIGAINKTTLREFDEACLADIPAQIPAEQIKQLRERSHVSQPRHGAQAVEHRAEAWFGNPGLRMAPCQIPLNPYQRPRSISLYGSHEPIFWS
eukprot:gene7115-8270_t